MNRNDWKSRLGVVYSTNPEFRYDSADEQKTASPSNLPQNLTVLIDRRHRAGKQVTVVKGFMGGERELEELGKILKSRCGTGGSVKEGEILIQGDLRDKIVTILLSLGHKAKRGN
ncbi:MAG: translation initiation factor [Bacteroidales bacterium]|nr:translation initiation factor [Bacteroidales bacterium]MDD2425731.1 translation initiation factor [Bacteroidales bacterium]MDD3989625.1 translation initiation factor [Bacteroidales bacterium]MDD4638684.1 translation initiation factor [Bacteroidales bacterium]